MFRMNGISHVHHVHGTSSLGILCVSWTEECYCI